MQNIESQIAKVRKKTRQVMSARDLSLRTEESYLHWFERYLYWINQHPSGTSEEKVRLFLSYLAIERNVASATQAQALNAIAFLYKRIFEHPLKDIGQFKPARKPRRLPTVLSRDEAMRLLNQLNGVYWLMASILYGSGLRQKECLSLRTQDIDFGRQQIMIRWGKGGKDRVVQLPAPLISPLKEQIEVARRNHRIDLSQGYGGVYLPYAIERKIGLAAKDFRWQFIFQASKVAVDKRSGEIRRHHLHPTALSRKIRAAAKAVGINKRVSAHTMRHSYATHLLESGVNLRTIQELLGHSNIRTTEIYTHVAQNAATSIPSPLEYKGNVLPMVRTG